MTDVNRTDWGLVITMDEDVRSAIHGYLVYSGVEVQGLKLGEVTLEHAFVVLTGGDPPVTPGPPIRTPAGRL